MDSIVPSRYKSYGQYVNAFRAFPLDVDGLKPVERRVLLSAFQIAKDKFVKSARIDGHCIGHYHPHGTSYGTIAQMVKQSFLDGQGNFGTNVGVEPSPPAAMRYTKCRLSKSIHALAFELIKYVPWDEGELDKEPAYLPTMFPICLLGRDYTQGIGFGFKTFIPCYHIGDLFKRLQYLLGSRKRQPIIKPISDCDITATNETLITLLTTGRAAISVQGRYETKHLQHKVILKSWPPGRKFESLLNKFSKERENVDIGYQDLSTTETLIVFEVLKQRNKDNIFKSFEKKLANTIKGSIPFDTVVVATDRTVRTASIDELLLKAYNSFISANRRMLNSEATRLVGVITEYQMLEKIKPVLSKYLRSEIKDINLIIGNIHKETGIPSDSIKNLFSKYRINKLLSVETDTDEVNNEIQQIKQKLGKIHDFVLGQYSEVVNALEKRR